MTPAEEKVSGNEIQSSLALSFATEYLKSGRLAENRRLLIIRAALGSTGFVAMRDMADSLRQADCFQTDKSLDVIHWGGLIGYISAAELFMTLVFDISMLSLK